MILLNFTKKQAYKNILVTLKKGTDRIIELRKLDVKEERLNREVLDLQEKVFKDLQIFVTSERSRLQSEMTSIEQRYKNTRQTYKDSQAELLKRQDFDLELSLMNRDDLLTELSRGDRRFSLYEINKIMSEYRDDTDVYIRAKHLKNTVKSPFLEDETYQILQRELAELELIEKPTIKDTMLYYPIDTGNGHKTINLNNLSFLLPANLTAYKLFRNELAEAVEHIRVEKPLSGLEAERVKPMKELAFSKNMFPGQPGYDIAERFRYLLKNFDKRSDDMFDPERADYNVYAHLEFLEKEHQAEMVNNPTYARSYREAEQESGEKADGGVN